MERLQGERDKASFPVREMTYFLDGGADVTALKVSIQLSHNKLRLDSQWNIL